MAYNPNCDACRNKRMHTEQEWRNHPRAGSGTDNRDAVKKPEPKK